MKIIKITESENYDGDKVRQAIVEYEGVKYNVSDNGKETLIFTENWDVAGGMQALTLEYVLNNFVKVLGEGRSKHFMSVFGF